MRSDEVIEVPVPKNLVCFHAYCGGRLYSVQEPVNYPDIEWTDVLVCSSCGERI